MGRIEAITRALSNLKKVGSKCKPEVDEVDIYEKLRCGSPDKSTGTSKATVYAHFSRGDPLSKGECQQFLAPDKQIQQDDDETDCIQVAKPCKGRPCSPICCEGALNVPTVASSTSSIDPTTPFSSDNVSTLLNRIPSTKVAIVAPDTLLYPSPRRLSSSSSSGVALKPSQPSILGGSKHSRCQTDTSPYGKQALVGSNSLSSGGTGGYGYGEIGLPQFLSAGSSMPSTCDRPSTSGCTGNVSVSSPALLRRQSSALTTLGGVHASAAPNSTVPVIGCGATAGVRFPALRPASYPLPQPPPLARLPHSCRPALACSDGASPGIVSPSVRSATGPGAVISTVGTRPASAMGSAGHMPSSSLSSSGSGQTRPTRILIATNLELPTPSVRQYAPQPLATPPPAHCQQHPPAAATSPACDQEQEQDRPTATMLLETFSERPSTAVLAQPWRRAGSVTGMQQAHGSLGGLPPHPPRTAPPSGTAAGNAAAREPRATMYTCGEGPLLQAGLSLGILHMQGLDREGVRTLTATDVRELVTEGNKGEGGSMAEGTRTPQARAVGDGGNVWYYGSSTEEGSSDGCSASSVDDSIALDIVPSAGRWFDAGDVSYCNPESEDVMARILDLSRTKAAQRQRLKGTSSSRSLNNIGVFYPVPDAAAASAAAAAAARRADCHSRASKAMQLTKTCMSPALIRQDPHTAVSSATTPLDTNKTSARGDLHPSSQTKERQNQQPHLLPPRYPSDVGPRPDPASGGISAPSLQCGRCMSRCFSSGGCSGDFDISNPIHESLVPRLDLPVMVSGSSTTMTPRLLAVSSPPTEPHGSATAANPRSCFGTMGVQAPCLQVVDGEGRSLQDEAMDYCGGGNGADASGAGSLVSSGGGTKPLSGQSQRCGSQLREQSAGRRATRALVFGMAPSGPAPMALASATGGIDSAKCTRFDRLRKESSFKSSLETGRC